MAMERLFDAFPPVTREQWEAVIKKELKDREPDALNVRIGDAELPPFHMAGEGASSGSRRRGVKRDGNPWRCTIGVDAADADANDKLLEGLMCCIPRPGPPRPSSSPRWARLIRR